MLKSMLAAVGALVMTAGAASALTVVNQDAKEHTIGVDEGHKESVHKVPANQTVTLKGVCAEGCGITGPWFYSWMANAGDTLTIKDGEPVMTGAASVGAAQGAAGRSEAPREAEGAPRKTK